MIWKHEDHSLSRFLLRTISAQSHLLGFFIAIVGLIVLLRFSQNGPTQALEAIKQSNHYWACFVFGITSVFVFAASSLYHFLCDGFKLHPKLDRWLERLDHFAIYFFIAGTYTPVLVNGVREPWQTGLMIAVWSIAFFGVFYTFLKPWLPNWAKHRFIYTGVFVAMGWLIVFKIDEIVENLAPTSLALLVAGGLSYSIGAVVYATERPRLIENIFGAHELWHVFVLLGYGFHYFTVLSFYW